MVSRVGGIQTQSSLSMFLMLVMQIEDTQQVFYYLFIDGD